ATSSPPQYRPRPRRSGVQRGSAPLRGPGGVPQSLFSSAPAGRKETLQQPWVEKLRHSKMRTITSRGLRLLMVSARYFPDMGGIETHVHEVARRLVHKGVDVTVLTTMPQHTLTQLPRETVSEGIRI